MAELFGVDRTRVLRHIHNIYQDDELNVISTCAENAQAQMEEKRYITRKIKLLSESTL